MRTITITDSEDDAFSYRIEKRGEDWRIFHGRRWLFRSTAVHDAAMDADTLLDALDVLHAELSDDDQPEPEPAPAEPAPVETPVSNLLAALEASVNAAKEARKAKESGR